MMLDDLAGGSTIPADSRPVAHWTAVAIGRAIGRRPKRVVVGGVPYVLFRAGGAIRCLADRCPHRHAPLSMGRVVGTQIECPYHGWQFDASGLCRAMPGLCGAEVPRVAVPTRVVREVGGLVFMASGDPSYEPYVSSLGQHDRVAVVTESVVRAGLVDVAENILDATHTHFTHKGLLRGLTAHRNRVAVRVTRTAGAVEARYEGEPQQDGIVSRLLEGGRTLSIGRFIAPGIAELEFHGRHGPNLVTTFHLREDEPGVTCGVAVLAGPRQHGLGHLKAALFMPLFKLALRQDRSILNACSANRARFGTPPPMAGPLDVLRADIATLAAGRPLQPGRRDLVMAL